MEGGLFASYCNFCCLLGPWPWAPPCTAAHSLGSIHVSHRITLWTWRDRDLAPTRWLLATAFSVSYKKAVHLWKRRVTRCPSNRPTLRIEMPSSLLPNDCPEHPICFQSPSSSPLKVSAPSFYQHKPNPGPPSHLIYWNRLLTSLPLPQVSILFYFLHLLMLLLLFIIPSAPHY